MRSLRAPAVSLRSGDGVRVKVRTERDDQSVAVSDDKGNCYEKRKNFWIARNVVEGATIVTATGEWLISLEVEPMSANSTTGKDDGETAGA